MKALCKTSNESEIKAYFEAVYKLRESREEFPVNFDEVWMLVYEDKKSAIRELKNKFIQDVDFQTMRKKVQASNVAGFVWADVYFLTVPCMEFFIARKVRPVFEVYRQVFHGAVDSIRVEGPKKGMGELEREMLRHLLGLEGRYTGDSLSEMLRRCLGQPGTVASIGPEAVPSLPSSGLMEPDPVEKGYTATWLMKKFDIQWTVHFFNESMVCHRMMEVVTSEAGKYNRLVGEGLRFGYNDRNKYVSGGVTPKYYEGIFMDLLYRLTEY
ncbi:MAG: hypothetical protein ACLUWB_18465 [Parabacteroides distasonis]